MITNPGMGIYAKDDNPDGLWKKQPSGYYSGGLQAPREFKPMLSVNIATGEVVDYKIQTDDNKTRKYLSVSNAIK